MPEMRQGQGVLVDRTHEKQRRIADTVFQVRKMQLHVARVLKNGAKVSGNERIVEVRK